MPRYQQQDAHRHHLVLVQAVAFGFGGEGIFFATLRGPGRVWLQSLPLSRMADRIYKAAPQTGGHRSEEGSILDRVGGLGDLIDGR